MRIKIGFISNSSTSSFLVVTTKENSDRALVKLNNPSINRIINVHAINKKLFGLDLIILSIVDSDGEYDLSDFGLNVNSVGVKEFHGDYEEALKLWINQIKGDEENCFCEINSY